MIYINEIPEKYCNRGWMPQNLISFLHPHKYEWTMHKYYKKYYNDEKDNSENTN